MQTSARDPRLPDATKSPSRTGPGIKLREHGLNVPKVNQTEGMRNPHSVTRPQPNQPPARNPPLLDATKSLQSRGDRDQAPIKMAIHIIKENNRSGVHRTGPTTYQETSALHGPTARPPRRMNGHSLPRYPTQSTARGPRTSPVSAPPGTRRESPSPHQIPHGPRAGQ